MRWPDKSEGGKPIRINFLEDELRKLFGGGDIVKRPVFVGRCCLGCIDRNLLVKLEFVCSKYVGNYDALQIRVINADKGLLDQITLLFADLWEVENIHYDFSFPGGEPPYIWVDKLRAEWYAIKPNEADYAAIRKAAADYLSVFRGEEICA